MVFEIKNPDGAVVKKDFHDPHGSCPKGGSGERGKGLVQADGKPQKIIGELQDPAGQGQENKGQHRCQKSCDNHPLQYRRHEKVGGDEIEGKTMEIIKHQRNGEHLGRREKGDALADPVGQMRKTAEKVGQGPVENEDSRRSTNRKLETYIIKVEGIPQQHPCHRGPQEVQGRFLPVQEDSSHR